VNAERVVAAALVLLLFLLPLAEVALTEVLGAAAPAGLDAQGRYRRDVY